MQNVLYSLTGLFVIFGGIALFIFLPFLFFKVKNYLLPPKKDPNLDAVQKFGVFYMGVSLITLSAILLYHAVEMGHRVGKAIIQHMLS